ncbi:RraA family protein [Alkalilacustris brevis]|uniref:RraA family protein n=1 Tax=Alkalilacustris brevis TaxID=2026338 RepID=UPI000E0D1457|nr:RraA family protein [Alkalilacustris brevis]
MKRLTGKIEAARIRSMETPRPPEGIVERIRALGCDTSLISDAMDDLGIGGTLPGSRYRPTIAGAGIVGPATTVRNVMSPRMSSVSTRAVEKRNGMAEMEAHNLASPGDVVVIEGVAGLSNMGGISALIAKHNGVAGAVIQGGIRDVGHSRAEGFPIWSSEINPLTGKWRIDTVEINGPVNLDGQHVRPGDLIIADDTGVCVLPPEFADEVVSRAEAQHALEARRVEAVKAGVHVADLPK